MLSFWKKKSKPPLLPTEEILGSGSFGIVYGPYSRQKVGDIFESLVSGQKLAIPTRTRKKFVLKVYREGKTSPYDRKLSRILGEYRLPVTRIIYPLEIAQMSTGQWLEIQEYGGYDFFNLLASPSFPWDENLLWRGWVSIVEILELGTRLIMEKNLFMSDIKPENMVFSLEKGLALIDIEFYNQRQVLESSRSSASNRTPSLVFTLNPSSLPIQFGVLFDRRRSKYFYQQYRRLWTSKDRKLNEATFQSLMETLPRQLDSVTVRKLALFTLFYPLCVIWRKWIRIAISNLTKTPENEAFLLNTDQVCALVLIKRLAMNPDMILDMMTSVLKKNFAKKFNRVISEKEKFQLGEEEFVFPIPKVKSFEIKQNYF
jgi:serine/threonine protein kinase